MKSKFDILRELIANYARENRFAVLATVEYAYQERKNYPLYNEAFMSCVSLAMQDAVNNPNPS